MKNVYQRIADVMKDIEYLAKDDSVSTGNSSYKAITEEKVTSAVRASLIKNGIVIIPIEQERKRSDERMTVYDTYKKRDVEKITRIVSVDTKYRIQNIDDPADFIIAASSGEGVDTQDKGVGKAMTYAYKYLLLRSFAIPTGEDSDKISSDLMNEEPEGGKAPSDIIGLQLRLYDIARKKGYSALSVDKTAKKKYDREVNELSLDELKAIIEQFAKVNKREPKS